MTLRLMQDGALAARAGAAPAATMPAAIRAVVATAPTLCRTLIDFLVLMAFLSSDAESLCSACCSRCCRFVVDRYAVAFRGGAVEFRLLGPVEVEVAGRRLDAGRPRQRTVLAALLVDAGRQVAAETLIDRVWGEDA